MKTETLKIDSDRGQDGEFVLCWLKHYGSKFKIIKLVANSFLCGGGAA